MRLNTQPTIERPKTHEGAPAALHVTPLQMLRRSVLSCLLWENEFYEDGQTIADRIVEYAQKVTVAELSALCIEARKTFNLRHVPLLLLCVLSERAAGSRLVSDTLYETISRADELAEFLAVYWRGGKKPLSNQHRKGLARAFTKFDAYALGKYNRDHAIKLRDVMFLVHPKPMNDNQAALWKQLADGTLASPDTWEVALSGGADKKETFERLLREQNLGYLALLRNLRNMVSSGVDPELVKAALLARKGADRVLPFRYVAAARAAPSLEPWIDQALLASLDGKAGLPGKTIVLVDVSGSMDAALSGKSDMRRIDAACALASLIQGDRRVFSFSSHMVEVPPRLGLGGVDVISRSQAHGGTDLGNAVLTANRLPHDRLIVITDEQSHSPVPDPVAKHAYMINVASARTGIGYGKWTHIDGFSEAVLRFIAEFEGAA